MRTKFVTFATKSHWIRLWFIVTSARLNKSIDRCESWTSKRLLKAGFASKFPRISLDERGVGFWTWKPFIIEETLLASNEGDLVIYVDVGRTEVKMLRSAFGPALRWMEKNGQDCIPGLEIPWNGPMSQWTKRDAFVLLECDREDFWKAAPIQASFSVWRNTAQMRLFIKQWREACADRRLVSDDSNTCGLPNMSNFIEHRFDQSVLSLLCMKAGLKSLVFGDGSSPPPFPDKSLEAWMVDGGEKIPTTITGTMLKVAASIYWRAEHEIRKKFPRTGPTG